MTINTSILDRIVQEVREVKSKANDAMVNVSKLLAAKQDGIGLDPEVEVRILTETYTTLFRLTQGYEPRITEDTPEPEITGHNVKTEAEVRDALPKPGDPDYVYDQGVWYDEREIRKGCDINQTDLRLLRKVTERSRHVCYIGKTSVRYNGFSKACDTWERDGRRGGTIRMARFDRIKGAPKFLVWRVRSR